MKQKNAELPNSITVMPEGVDVVQRISLTSSEAAEALGISLSMLRKLVKRREIPFFRYGRKILFSVNSLNAWVSSHEAMYKE